jgi:hypothetical protein
MEGDYMTRTFVLAAVLFTPAAVASAQPPLSSSMHPTDGEERKAIWRLADDLLATDNQISFNQGSHGAWYFMESHDFSHDVLTYRFLPDYRSPCMGVENRLDPFGISCWQSPDPDVSGNRLPLIAVNATYMTVRSPDQFDIPPRSVYMHPGFDRLAIIGWRSPVNGVVSVTGSFSDLDPNCDNGVLWSIDKGSVTLQSGDLPNGGAPMPFHFRVRVKTDDVLYFIVDPKNGDYACDTTGVDVTIARGR